MHLSRIKVADFRVLKNIDITFEKEFETRIFPLGSLNGGGKSTLLQLIFVLLHCSSDPARIPFLKNLLWDFKIDEGCEKRELAKIDIWDGEKTVKLDFFSYRDSYIKELLSETTKENIASNDYLTFSVFDKLKLIKTEISSLGKRIDLREKMIEQLERISQTENDEEQRSRLRDFINRYGRTMISYRIIASSEVWLEDIQKEVQESLEEEKITLGEILTKSKQLENASQQVLKYLKSKNLIYICNHIAGNNTSTDYDEVLLCSIENLEINQVEFFLPELSQKVFLAAPSTQVFLFLDQQSKSFLFKQNTPNNYYSALQKSKSHLPNFFTYDILTVDILVDAFKAVRDQDFREAIETGEYGSSYKALLTDLNFLLVNKRININNDFSGVTFKIDKDGSSREIYPEDLSHGELKRLSIYMWIKSSKIENSIVLMDEIEIAFHPDWQYKIISDLNEWSPSSQYILATHSYELCQALTPAHVKEIEPKLINQEKSKNLV